MYSESKNSWKIDIFSEIVKEIRSCTKCPLHKSRTNTVPGEGNLETKLMLVGEGPGFNEDQQGRPFVGDAGEVLSGLLETAGFKREDIFIANAVKCRPPSNRTPTITEILACKPYLISQIALIEPKVIVILGNAALVALLGSGFSISKVRGRPREMDGITYLPTYHPAAALYRKEILKIIKEDFLTIKSLIEK
jgi:uracil-DNA glycosylase